MHYVLLIFYYNRKTEHDTQYTSALTKNCFKSKFFSTLSVKYFFFYNNVDPF